MLVVKVELHSAITGEVTMLRQMLIANDATSSDPEIGNYVVRLGKAKQTDIKDTWENPRKTGEVKGHRRQGLDVWSLVRKAIEEVGL